MSDSAMKRYQSLIRAPRLRARRGELTPSPVRARWTRSAGNEGGANEVRLRQFESHVDLGAGQTFGR